MKDPIADLGDLVCEMLSFCYSDDHKESLRLEARKMGGTLAQMVAAAIAQRVSEQFDVQHKQLPRLKCN